MKINMQKWAQDIIDAKEVKNLPVLFFPVIQQMDVTIEESVKSAEKMSEVMVETVKEYPDMICAMTGMDLTVDSEAFGAEVVYSSEQAPAISGHVVESVEDIENLKVPDVHSGRVDVQTLATVEAAKVITDRPVFGGMLGPFSLAANIMDLSQTLMMTVSDPGSIHKLLEKCTDFLIARAKEYKLAGANGIFIAEPTAGIISPAACDEFSSVYVKKIVDAVQDDYFFIVLHDCGNVKKSVKSMYGTGAKGYHFGNSVDMKDILPQIPADVLVFGNIDPSSAFFFGTPESIHEKTTELLKDMEEYPHFVLSSGCDLAPSVKKENIDAYFRACEEFNAGK